MEREIRYCTTEDGVRIAYCVEGEGPPLFYVHYIYSFALSHFVPRFDDVMRRIGRGRRLIRYDMRGTGLSQRDAKDLSPEALLTDMEAVVRALALNRFVLIASTIGSLRAIDYAARYPDQVAGLILYNSVSRLADAFPAGVLQAFAQLARSNWQLATRTMSDAGVRGDDEREGLRWAEVLQNSITGETMARLIEAQVGLDVTPVLGRIECPTLISQSRDDPQYRPVFGEQLVEAIPNARLIYLEGNVGRPFFTSQAAVEAMESFLQETLPVAGSPAAAAPGRPLTPRETEILRLLAKGMTSNEISAQLSLSIRTVGRHITNIYDKIGARGRADATAYALRQGLTEE